MAAELHKPHQPYKPKAREEYMNSKQLAHFRNMLAQHEARTVTGH